MGSRMREPDDGLAPLESGREHFLSLFTAHYDRLFSFVMVLTPRIADAEDVLQETALVLWREFHRYDPSLNFKAWAKAIALNEVRRFWRKNNRTLAFSPEVLELLVEDDSRLCDQMDRQREQLAACLARLSPGDRTLVELYYQPDQHAQALADARGVTVYAIYKAVKKIRRVLLDCINRARASEA